MTKKTKNILQIFEATVKNRADHVCLRYKGKSDWQSLSWNEVFEKVLDLAGGLSQLNLNSGDRVCIFSRSRYEWTLADLAILSAGAISVPIYESSTSDQAEYILQNCEAKILFVEDEIQLKKVIKFKDKLTHLKQVILLESKSRKQKESGIYKLDEVFLLGSGLGKDIFDKNKETITLESDASFVYTSGTTGNPKGVILTHGNIIAEIEGLKERLEFTPETESLMFLPLAHILARLVQFSQIDTGFIQCYAESIDRLLDNIVEIKPHIMASVPRIFEKVYTRVMQGVENSSPSKKAIFNWALEVGLERSNYILNKKSPPVLLQLKWLLAFKLVFSKLHEKLGGRINYFISGGAPLAKEIGEFFQAAGFWILEGYGLTETSAAVCVNTKQNIKIGTVGKKLSNVELKIADDGEILIKGPLVFKGYYKNPEATKEAIDSQGWFHSGDIGVIDSQGFLKITDRKKDIIVTAAGKNIAPQNIENLLKTDPLISQVMVHGDRRKFLSALVTLNEEQLKDFAKNQNISVKDVKLLVKDDRIYQLIKKRIENLNKKLAQYETIKKFAIIENDFSVEGGELTPTLKVKRKFTSEKYKHILDRFYQDCNN